MSHDPCNEFCQSAGIIFVCCDSEVQIRNWYVAESSRLCGRGFDRLKIPPFSLTELPLPLEREVGSPDDAHNNKYAPQESMIVLKFRFLRNVFSDKLDYKMIIHPTGSL